MERTLAPYLAMADRLLLAGALAAALASLCCRSAPLQAPVETPQVDRDLVILAVDVSASMAKSNGPRPLDTAIGLFENASLDRTEVALFAFADKALKIYPFTDKALRVHPESEGALTGPSEQFNATRDTISALVTDRTPKQVDCKSASVKPDELNECVTNFSALFKTVNDLIVAKLNDIGRTSRIVVMIFSDGNADANESQGAACIDATDDIPSQVLTRQVESLVPLSITLVFKGRKECAASVKEFWGRKFEEGDAVIRAGDRRARMYFGFESLVHVPESHVRQEIIDQILERPRDERPVTVARCSLDQKLVRVTWNVGRQSPVGTRLFSAARLDSPGLGPQRLSREGASLDSLDPGGTVIQEWSRLQGQSAQLDRGEVLFGFIAIPSLNADDYRDSGRFHIPEPFVHLVPCAGQGAAIYLDVASFENLRLWPQEREFKLLLRPGRKHEMSGSLFYSDPKADAGMEKYPRLSVSDPDPSRAGIEIKDTMHLNLSPWSSEGETASWFGEVWVAAVEFIPSADAGNIGSVRMLQDGEAKDPRRIVAFHFGLGALFIFAAILLLSAFCWWMCRAHVKYRMREFVDHLRHRNSTVQQPACELLHEGCLCVAVLVSIGACFWLSLRPVWFQTLTPSTAMLGAEADLWRAVPLVLIIVITGTVRFCFPNNGLRKVRRWVRWVCGLGSAVLLLITGLKDMNLAPALFMIVLAFWVTGIVDLSLFDGNGVTTDAEGAPAQPGGIESPQES